MGIRSTNTVKRRVTNLASSDVINLFVTFVNFKLLGYGIDIQVYLKYNITDPFKIYQINVQMIRQFNRIGSVYLHIQTVEGISIFNIAFKFKENNSSNGNIENKLINNPNSETFIPELYDILRNNNKILFFDTFVGQFPEYNSSYNPTITDYRILECLILYPRMSFLDISRSISLSQRTVIRRINKMKHYRVLLGFSIIHNPSKMIGYNYYVVRLYTKSGHSNTAIIDKLLKVGISKSFLRPPLLTFNGVIILTFHSQNASDIVNTIQMLQDIEGVRKIEYSQPIRITWIQNWILDEIHKRIQSINKLVRF